MGHSDRVISVACGGGAGDTICTSSNDKTVKVWKPNLEMSETVKGHDAPITATCWPESSGDYAVTGSSDGVLKLWFIGDGTRNLKPLCTVKVTYLFSFYSSSDKEYHSIIKF